MFSIALPEGNYRNSVALGNAAGPADTTVKAELRRLMVEAVQTEAGKFFTRSFDAGVPTAKIGIGGEVRLKKRELTTEFVNRDDKLTFEFNGPRPSPGALEICRIADVTHRDPAWRFHRVRPTQ